MNAVARAFEDWSRHVAANRARLARDDEEDPFTGWMARARRGAGAVRPDPPGRSKGSAAARPATARSAVEARCGIANGSQAAVVKLASYAGGASRVKALLSYQSRDSTIPFEKADGTILTDEDEFDRLADDWLSHNRDASGRLQEPSKDVLYLTIDVPTDGAGDEARAALAQVFAGHRYAFRAEVRNGATSIHVVASAASSARDARGKAVRLFDNRKSMAGLEQRLTAAFGNSAEMVVRRWAHGVDGAGALLCRMTRDGEKTAQLSAPVQLREKGSADARSLDRLASRKDNWSAANAWKRSLRSREQREVAHVIISAKPGTDRHAFIDASRNTLSKEFAGHDYVFALHEDRKHLHIHAAVRMVDDAGRRMHPSIEDLRRWRETMAQEARLRQIPMEATRRFEKARYPAYELSDARMMERGVVPESVRRRVEAVRSGAVYVPARAEGMARATMAAAGWQMMAAAQPGHAGIATMAQRTQAAARGRDHAVAHDLRATPGQPTTGSATIMPMDAAARTASPATQKPSSAPDVSTPPAQTPRQLSKLTDEQLAGRMAEAADRLAQSEKNLAGVDSALSRLDEPDLRRRYESARTEWREASAQDRDAFDRLKAEHDTRRKLEERMANLARAREASDRVLSIVDQAAAKAEDLEQRALLQAQRDKLSAAYDREMREAEELAAIRRQQAAAQPGELSGPSYVVPRERPQPQFVSERVKVDQVEEVRYHHIGANGALAFSDRGQSVQVQDWRKAEVIHEAMVLATEKWGSITLTGSGAFKEAALRVAAAHGYEVTNPELRERFVREKARLVQEGARQSTAAQALPDPSPDTPAERAVRLEEIRERLGQEARRESREARHHERLEGEARAARRAARAENDGPNRPMPANPLRGEAIAPARFEQEKLLEEQKAEQNSQKTLRERVDEAAARRSAEQQVRRQGPDEQKM